MSIKGMLEDTLYEIGNAINLQKIEVDKTRCVLASCAAAYTKQQHLPSAMDTLTEAVKRYELAQKVFDRLCSMERQVKTAIEIEKYEEGL